MTYIKDYESWHKVKRGLNEDAHMPDFKERDIWWCSIGVNIGHEVDGKNASFNRPVLVLRKFSKKLFWGVPLSTQIKDSPHYYCFTFRDRQQSALLTQMRLLDSSRMTNRMGQLSKGPFEQIVAAVADKLLKR